MLSIIYRMLIMCMILTTLHTINQEQQRFTQKMEHVNTQIINTTHFNPKRALSSCITWNETPRLTCFTSFLLFCINYIIQKKAVLPVKSIVQNPTHVISIICNNTMLQHNFKKASLYILLSGAISSLYYGSNTKQAYRDKTTSEEHNAKAARKQAKETIQELIRQRAILEKNPNTKTAHCVAQLIHESQYDTERAKNTAKKCITISNKSYPVQKQSKLPYNQNKSIKTLKHKLEEIRSLPADAYSVQKVEKIACRVKQEVKRAQEEAPYLHDKKTENRLQEIAVMETEIALKKAHMKSCAEQGISETM